MRIFAILLLAPVLAAAQEHWGVDSRWQWITDNHGTYVCLANEAFAGRIYSLPDTETKLIMAQTDLTIQTNLVASTQAALDAQMALVTSTQANLAAQTTLVSNLRNTGQWAMRAMLGCIQLQPWSQCHKPEDVNGWLTWMAGYVQQKLIDGN